MMSFFFFKQKTAYEMRISDWSSDVCSSDLSERRNASASSRVWKAKNPPQRCSVRCTMPATSSRRVASISEMTRLVPLGSRCSPRDRARPEKSRNVARELTRYALDRKSVVSGKSVSVRVDLGGRRFIKKQKQINTTISSNTKTNYT